MWVPQVSRCINASRRFDQALKQLEKSRTQDPGNGCGHNPRLPDPRFHTTQVYRRFKIYALALVSGTLPQEIRIGTKWSNATSMDNYEPEKYWSEVGRRIRRRGEDFVAGDTNPYFDYKREKFLSTFLHNIAFDNRSVLELGPGPGGNLKYIAENFRSSRIFGADISATMLELAAENLKPFSDRVSLHKTDGRTLPFESDTVDVCFTATVLHHVTDAAMFDAITAELCRVSRDEVVLMEDIGKSRQVAGTGDFIGRRLEVYQSTMQGHGYEVHNVQFLNTRLSRACHQLVFFGIYKRLLNRTHREGAPIGPAIRALIGVPLKLTRRLDDSFPDRSSLAKMVFRKKRSVP